MLKKIVITATILITLVAVSLFGAKSWIKNLLPEKSHFVVIKQTQISDLPYVTQNIPAYRGNILAVVTSVNTMGEDQNTGYEHSRLAAIFQPTLARIAPPEAACAMIRGGRMLLACARS